jgi:hypothetical protein
MSTTVPLKTQTPWGHGLGRIMLEPRHKQTLSLVSNARRTHRHRLVQLTTTLTINLSLVSNANS